MRDQREQRGPAEEVIRSELDFMEPDLEALNVPALNHRILNHRALDIRVLDIQVLGKPTLSLGGEPCELSGKSLALLCYLAVEGETHRARLVDLLWSDGTEDAGRRNLRRELHRLRSSPVGSWLEADGERLRLRGGYALDLHQFQTLLDAGQATQAARLLRGPLLSGLEPPSADGFTEWREQRAAEQAETELSALSAWVGELEGQGRRAAAQEVCARMLRLDPLREQTHRQLMSLLYASGEREAALARYRSLEALLRRELGVEPLPQTTALYRQILQDQMLDESPGPSGTAGESASESHAESPLSQPAASTLDLPLMGRAEALQTLARSRVVLVTGEAGIGKTRLIREFLGQARTLSLHGAPETAGLPFAGLAALYSRQPELLERLDPVVRRSVQHLLPGHEGEAPADGQAALQLALQSALSASLEGGVLVVEDLHWLDAPTLAVVAGLIRQNAGLSRAVLAARSSDYRSPGQVGGRVLLSVRTAELESRPELETLLGDLESSGQLTRLPLRELDEAQVERLIARMSGQDAPLFSRRLYRATAGHPLFLLETLRSLRESGELQTQHGLWQTPYDQGTVDYAEISVPGSVRATVLSRVTRLGDAARRLLHAASVGGEVFTVGSLHAVCALSEWEALELLEGAEKAGLICAGPGGFRFGHDLYRHALLSDVGEGRRRLIHRQLARSLEAQLHAAPGGQQIHPAQIAEHYEQAGEMAAAWPHWQEAGRRSAQVYAQQAALGYAQRALACLPQSSPDELRAAYTLNQTCSELLRHLDDQPGRLRALGRMRGLAHALNDLSLRAEVAARLATYHTEQDDYAEAVRTAQEALHDLGAHLGAELRANLMLEAGAALACQEQFALATAALSPALDLLRGVNPARHANVLYWLGHCAARQHDWTGALDHYTRSVRGLPPERPTRGRVLTLWRLGQVQAQLGQTSAAEATFRQADADARTLNAGPLRALCLSDLGLLLLQTNQQEEAGELLLEAESCCGQDQEGLDAVAQLRLELLGQPTERVEAG